MWQWQLQDDINTNVNVPIYDIDMEAEQSTINILKAQGKKLICYISVGSWESYRDDANKFPPSVLGKGYDGFPGNNFFENNILINYFCFQMKNGSTYDNSLFWAQ
jgi:hypothetical protein